MKYPKVAYRFKELLNENALTAQQLSDLTHVGKASISHYVNGTHCPSTDTAEKIAKQFNINPVWLMGFDVTKKGTAPFDYDSPKYTINITKVKQMMAVKNLTIEQLSLATNIPIKRVNEIFLGETAIVSEIELRDISAFVETVYQNLLRNRYESSDIFYTNIMKELSSIKSSLNFNADNNDYSDEEQNIIKAYRQSDELTQAMVKRALGIEKEA